MTTQQQTREPVTVLAHHRVRPGDESVYKEWMEGISAASSRFPGYLGTEVISPMAEGENVWVSIFRFDDVRNLERWIESEERARWLQQTERFSDEPPQLRYHSLEFFFSPEENEGRAPPRWKMALVTFGALWPLVHGAGWLRADLPGPPLLLSTLSLGVVVALMAYLVMPALTRLLAPWLFAGQD